jgi:hypothetical protein
MIFAFPKRHHFPVSGPNSSQNPAVVAMVRYVGVDGYTALE